MERVQYYDHTDDTGNVFAFGAGTLGQTGLFYLESGDVILPMRIHALQSYAIRKIACGKANSFAISAKHDLYGWGDGLSGQLGFGEKGVSNEPYLISRGFKDVSAGRVHTLALSDDGCVYSFGDSDEGLTGHGDEEDLVVPRRIAPSVFESRKITKVECGYFHSACITEGGHLYTWGRGASFCLGTGTTETVRSPRRIDIKDEQGGDAIVISVSCGRAHTLVLTEKHHVYGFGDNSCGQVGVDQLMTSEHMQSNRSIIKVVEKPSRVHFPNEENRPTMIKSINAGSLHSCSLTDNHKLYVWGCGTSGQLGLCNYYNKRNPTLVGDSIGNIVSVSCGDRHTVCINDAGVVYGWGRWILKENILKGSDIAFHTPYRIYPPAQETRRKRPVEFCDVACGGQHTLLLSRYTDTDEKSIRSPRDSVLESISSKILGKVCHHDCVQLFCELNKKATSETDIRLLLVERNIGIQDLLTTIARCYRRKMTIKMFKDRDNEDTQLFINTMEELRNLMKDEVDHQIPIIVNPASKENLRVAGLLDIPMSSVANQHRGHDKRISCMVKWNDLVYTGSDDYVIRGWNKSQGMCKKVFEGHSDKVTDIVLQVDPDNPNNMLLCSSAYDNSVRVWNIHTEECIEVFKLHTDSVTSLVSADDNLLCSISVDCRMIVWDVKEMREVAVLETHKYPISAIAYDKQTHSVFTGDIDGAVYRWELKNVREMRSSLSPTILQHRDRMGKIGHKGAISCFWVSGSVLLSGSHDNCIIAWDMVTNKPLRMYGGDKGHSRMVTRVVGVTGKSYFFSSSLDENIIMWDTESGSILRTINNYSSEVQFDTHKIFGFMVADDGVLAFSGIKTYTAENARKKGMKSTEYVTYVYNLERLEDREINTFKCCTSILFGHFEPVTCGLKDRNYIFTASQDTHVRSYRISKSKSSKRNVKKSSMKSMNVYTSLGERLTYQVKPQIMAPIAFVLLLIDFAQMVALPFTTEDKNNQAQSNQQANSVMKMFQLSFSDGWRILFWLICAFFIPLLLLLFHFSPEVNFQNIRFTHIIRTPNPWKFVWLILVVYILLATGAMFVPIMRQLLQALDCKFMVPTIVSHCYTQDHAIYISVAAVTLVMFFLLVLRLAGVENDVSCINVMELESRLKGERQSIPGRSYLVEIKERWLSWKGDRPVHSNIHYMSKRQFSTDRLYVLIKTMLVMISVFFSDNRLVAGFILFFLMSIMAAAIIKVPPYYSRKISAFRLSLVIGMLWAFLHSIIFSFVRVSPTKGLVILGAVMAIVVPISYYISYQYFVFNRKLGKIAPLPLAGMERMGMSVQNAVEKAGMEVQKAAERAVSSREIAVVKAANVADVGAEKGTNENEMEIRRTARLLEDCTEATPPRGSVLSPIISSGHHNPITMPHPHHPLPLPPIAKAVH